MFIVEGPMMTRSIWDTWGSKRSTRNSDEERNVAHVRGLAPWVPSCTYVLPLPSRCASSAHRQKTGKCNSAAFGRFFLSGAFPVASLAAPGRAWAACPDSVAGASPVADENRRAEESKSLSLSLSLVALTLPRGSDPAPPALLIHPAPTPSSPHARLL